MEVVRIFRMIEDIKTCPEYRVRVELAMARLQAARIGHTELFALTLDLDRLFGRGEPEFPLTALRAFERAWFLIVHADAALAGRDGKAATRLLEAAAIAASGGELDAVARMAAARLASL